MMRVFLVFFVAVGLPLFFLAFYMLLNQAESESQTREYLYLNQVDFAVSNIEEFENSCVDFSHLINNYSTYLREMQNNDYKDVVYTYKEMYTLLTSFKNTYSDEIDVSMYIKNSGKVLGTTRAIDNLEDYEYDFLIEDFMQKQELTSFAQYDDKLIFISSLPSFYYDDSIIFLFSINISDLSLVDNENTFLIKDDEQILFDTQTVAIDELEFTNSEEANFIYLSEYVVCYQSTQNSIIIGNIFDTSYIKEEKAAFAMLSISVVMVCILLICLFSYVAAFVYSKPIIKLSATMKDLPDKPDKRKPLFDYISETLVKLESENKTYADTINKNKEIVKDQLVRQLIYNHRITTDFDLQTYLQQTNSSFRSHSVILVVLAVNNDFANDKFTKLSEMNWLINQLGEEIFREKDVFVTGTILENKFISFILDGDKIEAENHLVDDMIQETLNVLKLQIEIPINSAFSYQLDKIEEINEAFVLIKKQLEKSKPQNKTFLIKQDNDDAYCFPASINTSLINAIRSNEIKLVYEILDKMYEMELVSKNPDKDKYCYAILCKVISDFYDSWTDFSITPSNIENIFNSSNSLEDRYDQIKMLFEKIIGFNNTEDPDRENEDYVIAAKQYMNENMKEDFSISVIADKLNISTSYFNRIFKQGTGMTPLQYMTSIRLKMAKDLLSNTQMTVKDIAIEVGYKEIRSFVRYFKKVEGVTPTEYKSMDK